MMGIAFFDLDGTLVMDESQRTMLAACIKTGNIPKKVIYKTLFFYLLYKAGFINNGPAFRKSAYTCLTGICIDEIERICGHYVIEKLPHILSSAHEAINWHRGQGHKLALISSSLDPLVRHFAMHLGFEHHRGTQIIIEDGVLTGHIEGVDPWGYGKVVVAESLCAVLGVDPDSCYAYADHWSDLALLQFVGHPTAVNPDRWLRESAISSGMPIKVWR